MLQRCMICLIALGAIVLAAGCGPAASDIEPAKVDESASQTAGTPGPDPYAKFNAPGKDDVPGPMAGENTPGNEMPADTK